MAKRKNRKNLDDLSGDSLGGRLAAIEGMVIASLIGGFLSRPSGDKDLITIAKSLAKTFKKFPDGYRDAAEKHTRLLLNAAIKSIRASRGIPPQRYP